MTFFSNIKTGLCIKASALIFCFVSPAFGQTDLLPEPKFNDSNIEFHFDLEEQSTTIDFIAEDGKQLTLVKNYSDASNPTKTYIADNLKTLLEVYENDGQVHFFSAEVLKQRKNGDIVLEYSEDQSNLIDQYMDSLLGFGRDINENRQTFIDSINQALGNGVATRMSAACSIAIQNNMVANITEEVSCFPNPATAQCGVAIQASVLAFRAMLDACDFFGGDDDNGGSSGGSNGGGGSSGGNPTSIIIQGGGSGDTGGTGGGGNPLFHCEVFGGVIHCVVHRN